MAFFLLYSIFEQNKLYLMATKIDQIEGIGSTYAEKLAGVGASSVESFLEMAATPKGRLELAEKTDIASSLILKWANHADLFRIKGVAGQFAELLEASGVDTVKEFRNRNAENLHAKMKEVNDSKNLVNRLPSLDHLSSMIEEAKTLPSILSY
jgi:hypothetical protein